MDGRKMVLWYGLSPASGVVDRLKARGFELIENPTDAELGLGLLGASWIVVFNQAQVSERPVWYAHLKTFIDHGILPIIVTEDRVEEVRYLTSLSADFPWESKIRFIPNWKGVHFDTAIRADRGYKWHSCEITEITGAEKLNGEERLLVTRAFPKAEQVNLEEIKGGLSKSRVFLAYEKRREETSSIAHLTQPRLVKIGKRAKLCLEEQAMREVSPFVPFDLRPNLELFIEGFDKAIYVADFVDKSESMFDAARAGRAETAISNLFNRTLQRWRDRARTCERSSISLASAAEEFEIVAPSDILDDYLDNDAVQKAGLDLNLLWQRLKEQKFPHRAATIHGDLHGDNVRVRGDDAILIDLGSIKGSDAYGKGAPLCFDVAMLEVSLVFGCSKEEHDDGVFDDEAWQQEVGPYYNLDVIMNAPHVDVVSRPESWLHGCLQRIRAFGIYEQSDPHEYAIALIIAMWHRCRFPAFSDADKGRRIFSLITGARLLQEVLNRREPTA